jgi:hypothetical protein
MWMIVLLLSLLCVQGNFIWEIDRLINFRGRNHGLLG